MEGALMEGIAEDLFAAGAASVALGRMTEKDAEAFVDGLCKEAREDETFWDRNKGWIIPTMIGAGAFWAGASGERNGRRDRSYLSNAAGNIWNRVKILLGWNDSPAMRQFTDTSYTPEVR